MLAYGKPDRHTFIGRQPYMSKKQRKLRIANETARIERMSMAYL